MTVRNANVKPIEPTTPAGLNARELRRAFRSAACFYERSNHPAHRQALADGELVYRHLYQPEVYSGEALYADYPDASELTPTGTALAGWVATFVARAPVVNPETPC